MRVRRHRRFGRASVQEQLIEGQVGALTSGVQTRESRSGPRREATFAERIRHVLDAGGGRGGYWRL